MWFALAALFWSALAFANLPVSSVDRPDIHRGLMANQEETQDQAEVPADGLLGATVVLRPDAKVEFEMEQYGIFEFGISATVMEVNEKFVRLRSSVYCGWVSRDRVMSTDEGLEFYRREADEKPENAVAQLHLAKVVSSVLKEYEEAREICERALELDPDLLDAHKTLGNCYLYQSENDAAIECYESALEIDPNYAPAYNNRANILMNSGDNQAAIKDYEKAIQIRPAGLYYRNMAIAYYREQEFDKSSELYLKAVEMSPWDPISNYYVAAYVYLEHHDDNESREEAVRYLEKANELTFRQNLSYMRTLANTYEELGDVDKAESVREEIQQVDGEDDR